MAKTSFAEMEEKGNKSPSKKTATKKGKQKAKYGKAVKSKMKEMY